MKPESADSESAPASALAAELRIVIGAFSRRLREQAEVGDPTSAQKSVLLRLERDGPATGSALARAEAMRPQSMGAIIAVLETAGYVAGTPDPSDGRQTIISLTDSFHDSGVNGAIVSQATFEVGKNATSGCLKGVQDMMQNITDSATTRGLHSESEHTPPGAQSKLPAQHDFKSSA